MKYLFWNTCKRKNINEYIEDICISNNVDIFALAEYEGDEKVLLESLHNYKKINTIKGCKRIDLYAKGSLNDINVIQECDYYLVSKIIDIIIGRILLFVVHFPSKLYCQDHDFMSNSIKLCNYIDSLEYKYEIDKTIIIGDFNMNPFEENMVSALCFNSVMSRSIAKKRVRIVSGNEYKFFYNPMWNLLGDKNTPTATYYYNKSSMVNYYWNMFDQVLIRPSLIEYFDDESLQIIDKVNGKYLVNDNGTPSISDHLPIIFNLMRKE